MGRVLDGDTSNCAGGCSPLPCQCWCWVIILGNFAGLRRRVVDWYITTYLTHTTTHYQHTHTHKHTDIYVSIDISFSCNFSLSFAYYVFVYQYVQLYLCVFRLWQCMSVCVLCYKRKLPSIIQFTVEKLPCITNDWFQCARHL